MGEEGGINLYAFVGNNPVNNLDPEGLSAFMSFWDKFRLYRKAKPHQSSACDRMMKNIEDKEADCKQPGCFSGDCLQCVNDMCEWLAGPVGSPEFGACVMGHRGDCALLCP